MSAPTFRHFPRQNVWFVRPFRWDWEITDGIGGPVIVNEHDEPLAGHRWTRGSAELDAAIASARCSPSPRRILEERLAWVVGRLHRNGLPVKATIDERDRVCVRPLCACSTYDEVRILREFLAITSAVRWEVS